MLCLQDTQPGGGRKSILGNELNYFRQLYVENSGRPGDLRVSEVTCSLTPGLARSLWFDNAEVA